MRLTDQQIAGMTRQQLIDLVRKHEARIEQCDREIAQLENQIDGERREAKERNA